MENHLDGCKYFEWMKDSHYTPCSVFCCCCCCRFPAKRSENRMPVIKMLHFMITKPFRGFFFFSLFVHVLFHVSIKANDYHLNKSTVIMVGAGDIRGLIKCHIRQTTEERREWQKSRALQMKHKILNNSNACKRNHSRAHLTHKIPAEKERKINCRIQNIP